MNENKSKGTAKDLGGKAKEALGKVTGNERLKREGQADQVEGGVQKAAGDVEDAAKGK